MSVGPCDIRVVFILPYPFIYASVDKPQACSDVLRSSSKTSSFCQFCHICISSPFVFFSQITMFPVEYERKSLIWSRGAHEDCQVSKYYWKFFRSRNFPVFLGGFQRMRQGKTPLSFVSMQSNYNTRNIETDNLANSMMNQFQRT